MARLLVLACSVTKRPDPDGRRSKVAFLSAHYGFRDAATPIADYDARLTRDLAERMIAGGVTTRWTRQPFPCRPDTYGIHARAEIAGLTRDGAELVEEIALVGVRPTAMILVSCRCRARSAVDDPALSQQPR
ncbi:hypothetical protein [Methylobacterium platani]|uniref:hypothetical protein n=1 Tax=Methylobacterium platani TaxID=427683 RepID=UPI0009E34A2D|nr:hypothetical protein [Methylobacterium platani]